MLSFLAMFFADRTESDKGATAVEYGLMVALIAAVIVVAVTTLGSTLLGIFNGIVGQLS
jgi:pilus assembly protein Flp/PilA